MNVYPTYTPAVQPPISRKCNRIVVPSDGGLVHESIVFKKLLAAPSGTHQQFSEHQLVAHHLVATKKHIEP